MAEGMVALVCGGRDFAHGPMLHLCLHSIHTQWRIRLLREGESGKVDPFSRRVIKGADLLAREWAEASGIQVDPMPADWKRYGHEAGRIRNVAMVDKAPVPDFGVAFPGGSGTAHMVGELRRRGIPVVLVDTSGLMSFGR